MEEHGWVALLRAVNLGARNRVSMGDLRDLFAEHGCTSVRSYIQSGNVVFTSPESERDALAGRLERAVADTFGVAAAVVLRTFDEIGRVAGSHPFGADTSRTAVSFLAREPSLEQVNGLEELDVAPDRYVVAGSDVFLHYPNGVQGSRLTGALLERELGVPGTIRNWRTVTRLAEMARTAG